MKSVPFRILVVVFLLTSASLCAVPDSLIPPGGFKSDRPPPDPETTMKLGKGLMIGGIGAVALGGVVWVAEFTSSVEKVSQCELKNDADACSSSSGTSSLGPTLIVGGSIALPLGALIAFSARDDSGRNPHYYGSIHPRRIEAGFKQRF